MSDLGKQKKKKNKKPNVLYKVFSTLLNYVPYKPKIITTRMPNEKHDSRSTVRASPYAFPAFFLLCRRDSINVVACPRCGHRRSMRFSMQRQSVCYNWHFKKKKFIVCPWKSMSPPIWSDRFRIIWRNSVIDLLFIHLWQTFSNHFYDLATQLLAFLKKIWTFKMTKSNALP